MRRWTRPRPRFQQSNEKYFEFLLAHDLGLTMAGIAAMPYREFIEWVAWYKVRADKEEKAQKEAEKKAKAGRRR